MTFVIIVFCRWFLYVGLLGLTVFAAFSGDD